MEKIEEKAYSYACDKYAVACNEFDLCKEDFANGYTTCNDEVQPIFEWLLGHTDFPARKDGDGAYYWRKELRKKLNEIGLTINPLTPKP